MKDTDTEVLRCKNPICKGKLLEKLSHAVNKNALNIDGLSESTLEKFIELGWVFSIKDIFQLYRYEKEMEKLDGFGKKSTDRLITAIEKSRRTTLDRFIYSLSIPLIGKTASKTISKYFNGSYESFRDTWSYVFGFDWTRLKDFDTAMYASMVNFFLEYSEEVNNIAEELIFENPPSMIITDVTKDLSGKTFAIIGSLNQFSNRDAAKEEIESIDGKVSGSVSAKTDYLVCNQIFSTEKCKKAKELGIPIINEEQLITILR